MKLYFYIWIEELMLYFHWITITRKFGKHLHATYGTLNSCFDLIRSHQQCILWSTPLEIEPTRTECRSPSDAIYIDFKILFKMSCQPSQLEVWNMPTAFLLRDNTPTKMSVLHMTLNNLIVRLKFGSSGECGVLPYCHLNLGHHVHFLQWCHWRPLIYMMLLDVNGK